MPRTARFVLFTALVVLSTALPAGAHTAGRCVPGAGERCETWVATIDNPDVAEPSRSDQFAVEVLASAAATYVVSKDVALNPDDPYSASGRALVTALDRSTGAVLWQVPRSDDVYLNTVAAALSPDGSRLIVTGGAYDAFPVAAKNSQLLTLALDTRDGSLLWSTRWEGRSDATDNGKAVVVSPDGTRVYATGVTTSVEGALDYVTIGYDAADGRLLWSLTYDGPADNGQDAPFGLAIRPDGSMLYVTGWSDGLVEFDSDYATVAYALGTAPARPGRAPALPDQARPWKDDAEPVATQAWVARYDGVGQNKSDRANAVAADPDGSLVYVTGDSYTGPGGSDYSYATVAYDAITGEQRWDSRLAGARGGFSSARTVVAAAGRVLVAGQTRAAGEDDGNDAVAVAYASTSGQELWRATVAPVRSDDLSRDLAFSPDGGTAYLVTSTTPIVRYTSLARLTLTAFDAATGAVRWRTELDAGSGNALRGVAVSVPPGGEAVTVAGDVTRSANPMGSRSQDVYDVLVASFPS